MRPANSGKIQTQSSITITQRPNPNHFIFLDLFILFFFVQQENVETSPQCHLSLFCVDGLDQWPVISDKLRAVWSVAWIIFIIIIMVWLLHNKWKVLTRIALQTPCFCASNDDVCVGFILCISAQNQLKLRVLYSCVYISYIWADVSVTDWNTVFVDKYRWKSRIQQWSRCINKCTVIYHVVYEQSTTHWFLYKPSNISCSIIMAVCYRVWRFCTRFPHPAQD